MAVNVSVGAVYPPSPAYEVGREKIAEFATGIGSADPVHRDPRRLRENARLPVSTVFPASHPVSADRSPDCDAHRTGFPRGVV